MGSAKSRFLKGEQKLWGALAFSIALLVAIRLSITVLPPKPPDLTPTLVPPSQLKYFTFGYRELMADIFWLRLLQNVEYCAPAAKAKESQVNAVNGLSGSRVPRCEKGWSFHMLDAITELAPRFRQPYLNGGIVLSVAADDIKGASIIFNKGLPLFPHDWNLYLRAAHHFLNEEQDFAHAADLLVKAGDNGAPRWVYSLAGNLYSRLHRAEFARMVLEDALKKSSDDKFNLRIQMRLDEVNKVLAEEQAKAPAERK